MRKKEPDSSQIPSIQVLERMFTLMDVLAVKEDSASLKEISEKTGLHPSTAHRILNDLVLGRFVDRPEPGQYRLGMRLLELGNFVKARLNVRDAAVAPMRELHLLTQQPAMHSDELLQKIGCASGQLSMHLLNLSLAGLIVSLPGHRYQLS